MRDSPFLRRAAAIFLPLAGLLTIAVLLVYGAVQHAYRTAANDPQLQIATDAVNRLNAGVSPRSVAGERVVDLASSLAVHTTVFDRKDGILASSARLDGAVPKPPNGVMDDVMRNGQHWLSWQPQSGVRVAAVVMPWRGGTVLVGRSLGPTEDRETELLLYCAVAWVAGMVGLAAAALAASWLWPDSPAGQRELVAG